MKRRWTFLTYWTVLIASLYLSSVASPAFSTGVPKLFTLDPVTVRQKEKPEATVLATVVLKAPSPSYFVCQIRSSDKAKVSFGDIVFRKGQREGTSLGTIYWRTIPKDCEIKISAFNIDVPETKIWATVVLKTADVTPPEDNEDL